jgi:hypothetical protein
MSPPRQKVKRAKRRAALSSLRGSRANFAKLWSAVAIELPLWEGGGTVVLAQTSQASRAAGPHHPPALPKRWPCHRSPKCCARNRAHGRWSIATRQARTCTPPGEHCGAPGAHVHTAGGALRRGRRARAHRRGSIAARPARTCTPPGEHCGAAGAHVRVRDLGGGDG